MLKFVLILLVVSAALVGDTAADHLGGFDMCYFCSNSCFGYGGQRSGGLSREGSFQTGRFWPSACTLFTDLVHGVGLCMAIRQRASERERERGRTEERGEREKGEREGEREDDTLLHIDKTEREDNLLHMDKRGGEREREYSITQG